MKFITTQKNIYFIQLQVQFDLIFLFQFGDEKKQILNQNEMK